MSSNSNGKTKHTTINVPVKLAERIDKNLDEEAYSSRAELVRNLIRDWLRELEIRKKTKERLKEFEEENNNG